MKTCKLCKKTFPIKPEAKPNSKASGFMGNRCWLCYLEALKAPRLKDKVRVTRGQHRKINPEQYMRYVVDRRLAEIQATPKWVKIADLRAIYELAMKLTLSTGIKHSVDHIIPLRHPLVSGLNVPANLQVMTNSANSSKGNKFEID
jgi:5-methylcytosine-specific restriction endonuclease McrA